MKSLQELHMELNEYPFVAVNAHVHTHLCDGRENMTVENIASEAKKLGIRLIILTPHFHKQVSDASATLYEDTDSDTLVQLREEINHYNKKLNNKVKFMLSTEADILNVNGDLSLNLTKEAEDALDFITMAVNYHPLLPLNMVEVTYSRCIERIHDSGEYTKCVRRVGTVSDILEALYETEVNAIMKAQYPAMLGHFFAAHSYAKDKYNWFGANSNHVILMKKGATRVMEACEKTRTIVDITGIHCGNKSFEAKAKEDGFFFDFQKWFISQCKKRNITIVPGGDTHALHMLHESLYYSIFENL